MPRSKHKTPLQKARDALGFTARSVATSIGLDPSGFIRIEQGKFTPRQDTARLIFDFYGEILPLGMIYDCQHSSYRDWMTDRREGQIRAHGRRLEKSLDTLHRTP